MSILSELLAKDGKNIARQWAIESIPGIAKTISEKLGKLPLSVSSEELETLMKKPFLNTIKKEV
jgi:hypothetical protein